MAEAHIYLVDEPSLGLAPGTRRDDRAHALQPRPRRRRARTGRAEPHAPGGPHRPHRPHPRRQGRQHRARNPAAGARVTAVLITTVFLAAVYSLVALGLSLTWAGLGFLNLAHGVTYSAAAVGAYEAVRPHRRQRARRAAGGHHQRRARRPADLPRRLPAARRQAQLRPAHPDRHARARARGENLLLDKFGPQPQAFPEIFGWLPTISVGRHERHERPAGRRALRDRARDRLRRSCSAARASASACAR